MNALNSGRYGKAEEEEGKQGRGRRERRPQGNEAQVSTQLTWKKAIAGGAPLQCWREGQEVAPENQEIFCIAQRRVFPDSALKGPKRAIAFFQVSSDGGGW